MVNIKELAEEINKFDSFYLSVHVNPDGDCIGSVLALERLLQKMGKKTQIICASPIPRTLAFLPTGTWKEVGQLEVDPTITASLTVDTPSWERLSTSASILKKTHLINIDHHISNKKFGAYNYIDVKAAACGEIVFSLFEHFNVDLDKEIAEMIYTSISTDTGSFKYSNTTSETHRVISRLLETGLEVEKINQNLYGTFEEVRLNLLELIIKNRQFAYDRKLSYAAIRYQDLEASGGKPEDMEGGIDFLRGIKGVLACFVMTEWKPGVLKFSFRSSSDVDVNAVAAHLNGGGHKKAAGAGIEGDFAEELERVVGFFKDELLAHTS
jgi:phosphoesterase RecJ-like protein